MSVISIMMHLERGDSLELARELADHLTNEDNTIRLSEIEASAIDRPEPVSYTHLTLPTSDLV